MVDLNKALSRLAALAGSRGRSYSTFDFGRDRDPKARSVVAPSSKAAGIVAALRKELPPGLIAFIGTSNWLGSEKHHGGSEIVVAPGSSQFDTLRIARSDAVNYDKDTEDLIRQLSKWDRDFGIDIFHAETDTIEFRFKRKPANLKVFAREVYKFCPDIVDQGVGSEVKLEQALHTSNELLLWWD